MSKPKPADHAVPPRPGDAIVQSPDWYKDAVIYQTHIKAFFDANSDGIGDFDGADPEARLYPGARRLGDLAAAVLSLAAARRRLRHRRLPHRQPGLRHAQGRAAAGPRGAPARPAGHHRAGHQPHLRPAPLVPARPHAPSPARRTATTMSGATPTRSTRTPGSSSSTPRSRTGPGIRSRRPISGTASTATSRT